MATYTEQHALISAFPAFCEPLPVGAALFVRDERTGGFSLIRANARYRELCGYHGDSPDLPAPADCPLFGELGLAELLSRAEAGHSPLQTEVTLSRGHSFLIGINAAVDGIFPLFIRETTDLLRKHRELASSRAFFRGLAEDAVDFILRFSWPEGRIEFAGERMAALLGSAGQDLVGHVIFDLLPAEVAMRIRRTLTGLTPDSPAREYIEQLHLAGGPVAVDWKYRGFFDGAGSLISVQALGRDVTEQIRERDRLRRSEERFRTLVEDAGAYFCEFDGDGVLSYVNAVYVESMGLAEQDLLAHDFYRFIPEGQRNPIRQGLVNLSKDSPFFTTEHQVFLPGGKMLWQRWTNRALFNEDGSVRRYCCVGYDITERKNAEKVREEQARHLEALFEQSPIAIAFSRDHRVQRVNAAFCELFHLDADQVVGRDMREVLSRPGQIRGDCDDVVDRMDAGETVVCDAVRLRGDGVEIPVRVFGMSYECADDAGGRGYFAFFQDLADRVRLKEEIQRNRIVVQESPVVIFEAPLGFGAPCRFISENVSQFGYSARELVEGRISLDMKTHPEDMRRLRDQVARADREGRSYRDYTYRLLTSGGSYRWVNERNHVLPGADGQPDSIIGVLIDQTELVEAQKEMQAVNEVLARHARAMEESWESTLNLLAGITELRDPYTRGHQLRVAHLCRALGEELGFEKEPLRELVQAATIHDIGKMEIPSDYLNRPGPLSRDEFEFIKLHPEKGFQLLNRISVPGFLAEIVRQHHERLDGSGYPRGLVGEEILLSARILAVADVVEAMLSHRPYRPALGLQDVLAHITCESGRSYDSEVVRVCRRLFLEKGYVLIRPEEIL